MRSRPVGCSRAPASPASWPRDLPLDRLSTADPATVPLGHDEQLPPAARGRVPKDATPKERMARKQRTKPGRAACNRRKATVELVFWQIMTCQNGRRLLLRGEHGARGERRLLAALAD